MSKGPGNVQRAIPHILAQDTDRVWWIDDLAAAVYGIETHQVEKKHRVAVLRALRTAIPYGWRMDHVWVVQLENQPGTHHRTILTCNFSVESQLEKARYGGYYNDVVPPAVVKRIERDVDLNCRLRDATYEEGLALYEELKANMKLDAETAAAEDRRYDETRAKAMAG